MKKGTLIIQGPLENLDFITETPWTPRKEAVVPSQCTDSWTADEVNVVGAKGLGFRV